MNLKGREGKMIFTKEELEEIRKADEEIEAAGLSCADYKAAMELDEYIYPDTVLDKQRKAYQREYRTANKDKIAAYQREYYAENKDKRAAQQREYRTANKSLKTGYAT